MIINCDKHLAGEDDTSRLKETIELPVDLLDQQGTLIDRIFGFAFDVLEVQTVELRIPHRPQKAGEPNSRLLPQQA